MPTKAKNKAGVLKLRNDAIANLREVHDQVKKEDREPTPEESNKMKGWTDEIEEHAETLNRWDQMERSAKALDSAGEAEDVEEFRHKNNLKKKNEGEDTKSVIWTPGSTDRNNPFNIKKRELIIGQNRRGVDGEVFNRSSEEYAADFKNYIRRGDSAVPQNSPLRTDDDERAGYFVVPEQMSAELLKNLDDQVFIQALSRVITVTGADSLGIRKRVAKFRAWNWGQELSSAFDNKDSTLKFGKKNLTPHYLTGSVDISRDLLRRAVINIEQYVLGEASLDLSEFLEQSYLYGNGNGQCLGLMTPSANGISTAQDIANTGSRTTTIGFDDIVSAYFKLKAKYRKTATWMLHRDIIKDLVLLKDSTGQPLFLVSLRVGEPDTLMGRPVMESEWMPNTKTAGLYWGILANFNYYYIAWALDTEVQRLNELKADKNLVQYIFRAKVDAMPVLEEAFVRPKYAAS